jgi:hypothetical protein
MFAGCDLQRPSFVGRATQLTNNYLVHRCRTDTNADGLTDASPDTSTSTDTDAFANAGPDTGTNTDTGTLAYSHKLEDTETSPDTGTDTDTDSIAITGTDLRTATATNTDTNRINRVPV